MSKNIYDHNQIEEKWMHSWEEQGLFQGSEKQEKNKESHKRSVGQVNVVNHKPSTINQKLIHKPKKYILFAFAYPSGSGLHVGHVESKTALDILSRYYRMQGEEVFFPVGWDAFGLPAENYAVKTGVHPAITTKNAIDTFRGQIKRVGISYDWKNEIATNHPEYYKWTQWIFLQLHHKQLAYQKNGMVNWCPSCQTVLANEQVVNGQCERCGSDVIQKEMKQWYFNITKYQDELISGLDQVDWPNATKQQQLNWIGKSEGAEVTFKLKNNESALTCFTTRLDTIFGVTFVVISPEKFQEMNLIEVVPEEHQHGVRQYIENSYKKTEEERKVGEKDKTGIDTKLVVVNPVSNQEVPLFVADYVLANYGTGVVMGVPAHDPRDRAFAKKFHVPIIPVIWKEGQLARSYLMGGTAIRDQELEAIGVKIVEKMENGDRKLEIAESKESWRQYEDLISKKMEPGFWNDQVARESGFIFKYIDEPTRSEMLSLQVGTQKIIRENCERILGKPITEPTIWEFLAGNDWYSEILFHPELGVLINSGEYTGLNSQSAMDKIIADHPDTIKKTTTYKLRDWLISRQRYWGAPIPVVYDPDGNAHPVKEEHLPWTLPTDVEFKPTGESPLTYSKEFIERTERLYGKGWRPEYDTMDTFVDSSWYFLRYIDSRNKQEFASPEQLKKWLPVDLYMIGPEHIVLHLLYSRFFTKFLRDEGYLHFDEPFMKMRHQGMILGPDGKKMSKSKGNVINPDDVIEKYGADTLRVYEMFMGPIEADKPWNTNSVVGVYRFLNRVWQAVANVKLSANAEDADVVVRRKLHQTIKKVSEDIPNLKFNTAIASMMELMNVWEEEGGRSYRHGGAGSISTDSRRVKDDTTGLLHIDDVISFIKVLCPFAPFMAEELWSQLSVVGGQGSVHTQPWPQYDPSLIVEDEVKIVIQVNGKLRSEIMVTQEDSKDKEKVIAIAREDEKARTWLQGREIIKEIYVPGKLVNMVITQ